MDINNKTNRFVIKKLISKSDIEKRIVIIAKEINKYYLNINETILILGVLKSSIIFFSTLLTKLNINCQIDFLYISSFDGKLVSQNKPIWRMKPNFELKGRKILVIEDIVDSGNTINLIIDYLTENQVDSFKIATFLIKKTEKKIKDTPEINWYGFKIEDLFVVGYGLDYEEKLRNLPYVGKLVLLN